MADLELLASGYGLIEGPRVDEHDRLYFSDVPNGGVYRRSPDGTVEVVVPKRRGVGGMALHADGGLVMSGRNICHSSGSENRILFEDPEVAGFNDLHTLADGSVVCGSLRSNPFDLDNRTRELGSAHHIALDGTVTVLYGEVGITNGIGISPAGDVLYHADTHIGNVIVHDLAPGPAVSDRRLLFLEGDLQPDGLAVDEEGGIWVALYGGGRVQRVRPNGALDLSIEVPASEVTSCCFGGADRRDLYIVTAGHNDGLGGSVFRTRTEIAGLPTALARV
ncbi:MAG: SMP-30/gluconolactonase/LRE family protein [Actinomycetia bacterium]|nr:SMP-30/gluconolactonase/LRE family protein [Actinomycetes bacterium]